MEGSSLWCFTEGTPNSFLTPFSASLFVNTSLIRYCKTTRDPLVPSVWGPVDKKDDPYTMASASTRLVDWTCDRLLLTLPLASSTAPQQSGCCVAM